MNRRQLCSFCACYFLILQRTSRLTGYAERQALCVKKLQIGLSCRESNECERFFFRPCFWRTFLLRITLYFCFWYVHTVSFNCVFSRQFLKTTQLVEVLTRSRYIQAATYCGFTSNFLQPVTSIFSRIHI